MNILICSQYGELQVDEVCKVLLAKGVNPVIFERYRKDQFISYHYGKDTKAILQIGDQHYPLNSDTFPSIWYRPKPIILSEVPGENAKIKEKFCFQEWRVILQSLEMFLIGSKWINAIQANHKASNKAYQLKLAHEIGLMTPPTVITNDANQALKLFNDNRVIYKTLSSFFSANEAIYTNEIHYDQVIKSQDEISMAPGIFQQYIEKNYELRITVIGNKLFVVRINSQKTQASAVDWRRHAVPGLYEPGVLSPTTEALLLQLHKKLGLIYAAYDFIVDKDGNEIFIECNPSGQWLWLESILNLNISDYMAYELMSVN